MITVIDKIALNSGSDWMYKYKNRLCQNLEKNLFKKFGLVYSLKCLHCVYPQTHFLLKKALSNDCALIPVWTSLDTQHKIQLFKLLTWYSF